MDMDKVKSVYKMLIIILGCLIYSFLADGALHVLFECGMAIAITIILLLLIITYFFNVTFFAAINILATILASELLKLGNALLYIAVILLVISLINFWVHFVKDYCEANKESKTTENKVADVKFNKDKTVSTLEKYNKKIGISDDEKIDVTDPSKWLSPRSGIVFVRLRALSFSDNSGKTGFKIILYIVNYNPRTEVILIRGICKIWCSGEHKSKIISRITYVAFPNKVLRTVNPFPIIYTPNEIENLKKMGGSIIEIELTANGKVIMRKNYNIYNFDFIHCADDGFIVKRTKDYDLTT